MKHGKMEISKQILETESNTLSPNTLAQVIINSHGKKAHNFIIVNVLLDHALPNSAPLIKAERRSQTLYFPAGIYLFKVNNRNTRTRCEICSKLTIETLEQGVKYVQSQQ